MHHFCKCIKCITAANASPLRMHHHCECITTANASPLRMHHHCECCRFLTDDEKLHLGIPLLLFGGGRDSEPTADWGTGTGPAEQAPKPAFGAGGRRKSVTVAQSQGGCHMQQIIEWAIHSVCVIPPCDYAVCFWVVLLLTVDLCSCVTSMFRHSFSLLCLARCAQGDPLQQDQLLQMPRRRRSSVHSEATHNPSWQQCERMSHKLSQPNGKPC